MLYQWYASFLEVKGNWLDAHVVYQIGISRNAEPLEKLKEAHSLFVTRMSERLNAASLQKIGGGEFIESGKTYIKPWSSIKDLLKKISPQIRKYDGYHLSNKVCLGKEALSSLHNSKKNNIIDLGSSLCYMIVHCQFY